MALAALPHNSTMPLSAGGSSRDELWYARAAERWFEALPIGNGRLGGMVFGGATKERIALSESTAWSGAPSTNDVNPDALEHLAEIRQLLFAGKYVEARELCQKYLLDALRLSAPTFPSRNCSLASIMRKRLNSIAGR